MHIKGPFKQHAPGYLAEKVDRVDRYTEVLHTSRNIMLHRPCSIITPRDAEQKIELLLRGHTRAEQFVGFEDVLYEGLERAPLNSIEYHLADELFEILGNSVLTVHERSQAGECALYV